MLELFNNELDKGKLYVSYPMVEALRDTLEEDIFKDMVEVCEKSYKEKVSQRCVDKFKHFNNYTQSIWKILIEQHCKKVNYIVNNIFEVTFKTIEQIDIFNNQKAKYIDNMDKVAVLSAFPIFLIDYYGYKNISKILGDNIDN